MAVALISGQLYAAKLAKSEIMLAVLLFGKKYENQAHASNVELPKIMPVLDLKPGSPVFWRSKSCKTISLTSVYFFLFKESASQKYIDHRHPSTYPLESFFDSPHAPPPNSM